MTSSEPLRWRGRDGASGKALLQGPPLTHSLKTGARARVGQIRVWSPAARHANVEIFHCIGFGL